MTVSPTAQADHFLAGPAAGSAAVVAWLWRAHNGVK
jgi:hypothetical protein